MKGYKISFEIYAESEEEAQMAQQSIIGFIEQLRQRGRAVTAPKIARAVGGWQDTPFIRNQILNYFK